MKWVQAHSEAHGAYERCCESGNMLWRNRWFDRMKQLEDALPHGSGIDGEVSVKRCTDQHLSIVFDFHHMDDSGGYDGWTNYAVFANATFSGITVTVRGQDRNGMKDYLGDLFQQALTAEAPEVPWAKEVP